EQAESDQARRRAALKEPGARRWELVPVLSRAQAIRVAVGCLKSEPVIHANGYICRESYAVADRPGNFYMIGSMGLASAIGLGVALSRAEPKIVVFDGDGNLLMNFGILPMVGSLGPKNFVHLAFDNEVYGSTGNQRSISRETRLDRVAAAAGYRTTRAVVEPGALQEAVSRGLAEDGPTFILVKVTAAEENVPRIPYPPATIRDRFRAALGAA
ncbi:MAG: thiamine pyrophosphate-dependent enzyme, partial [candidate division NC10 bacterium]